MKKLSILTIAFTILLAAFVSAGVPYVSNVVINQTTAQTTVDSHNFELNFTIHTNGTGDLVNVSNIIVATGGGGGIHPADADGDFAYSGSECGFFNFADNGTGRCVISNNNVQLENASGSVQFCVLVSNPDSGEGDYGQFAICPSSSLSVQLFVAGSGGYTPTYTTGDLPSIVFDALGNLGVQVLIFVGLLVVLFVLGFLVVRMQRIKGRFR